MKVMVTGAAGQVGHALVACCPSTFQLLALDRSQLDITDAEQVEEQIRQFRPDVIINAAAYTAVDKAESDETQAYAINCLGAKQLAMAAHRYGAALLQISTDYVFDGDKAEPYSEEDATAPASVYGASKLAGEQAVAQQCPRHIILRTSWVFGEQGANFVKTMLRLATNNASLRVVADQFGSPTSAEDIAITLWQIAASVAAADFNEWGIYHYSGAPYINWAAFAGEIFREASEAGLISTMPEVMPIASSDWPTAARRPTNSCLSHEKIGRVFSIQPCDWRKGLASNLARLAR